MPPGDDESAAHDRAAHDRAAIRRKALGDFLRSARARVRPESAGLPAGTRRRTPGLRREEVAQLSGISATWYTWIEQGRNIAVSPRVWARLAEVLGLARAERHYLFELADCADPQHEPAEVQPLPPALADSVHSILAPAYILDRCWNVLASNAPLEALFQGWPAHDPRANLMRFIFLDPAAPGLVVDWDTRASRAVAEFRADVGGHTDAPDVRALVAELTAGSPVFAHWWARHAVVEREGGWRSFYLADGGQRSYQQLNFRLTTRPDCKLVMLLEGGAALQSTQP